MNPADPLALGDRLARGAGLGGAVAATPLAGGRNNRVLALDLEGGGRAVLKIYFRHPGDTRDRLGAEWRYLQHACALAPGQVARPLACDEDAGAALYSFVDGAPFALPQVDAAAVDAAARFIAATARPGLVNDLAPASEACFSIGDHIQAVERRVSRLCAAQPEGPLASEAAHFIAGDLVPAWRRLREELIAECVRLGVDPATGVAPEDAIASPSDFGFHNVIRTPDGPVFIDFEYAGRDDPAKLVCDFFCQPALPVPAELRERFMAGALDAIGLGRHRARVAILLGACRLKWIAIMLNEFLPVDESRRVFSSEQDREQRRKKQLDAARASLDALRESSHIS